MFHLPPNKSQNCWPSYLKIQFSIFSIHFWIKCRKWNLLRIQFYSRDDNLASMRNFLWLTQWFTGKIQPNANYIPAPFKKIRAFIAEIFAKRYWLSRVINFQCISHIFTVTALKSLQRWIITVRSWISLETSYQNVHI